MSESDDTAKAPGKGRAGTFNLGHLTVAELTEVIRRAEALRQEKQEEAKAALLAKWKPKPLKTICPSMPFWRASNRHRGQGRKVRRGAGAKVAASSAIPKPGIRGQAGDVNPTG